MKKSKILWLAIWLFCLAAGLVLYKKWDNWFPADEWTITQYGPRDMNSSFYTIYNPHKGLIVVDGGWKEDAQYVRDIIHLCGGRVDLWILSHPHQDHIGAFNEIYRDPSDISIGDIYTVDMASPEECLAAASWDSVDAYRDFLALNPDNLRYLYAGDEFSFHNLNIKVYSAFGEAVSTRSGDYLNDGSLMFEVFGQETSFLFCSDVGVSMSDLLLTSWGQELQADYLQMGHHGYGGLLDNFYQVVSPSVAFFDAPDWLVKDTTGKYDTPEHVALMEGMGSQIKSFNSAPNAIILK